MWGIRQNYRDIFVIVSPPRCSSTALARIFWEQRSVRCYLHEPFDRIYHRDGGLDDVLSAFDQPIEIRESGTDLVIKEMTFQIGGHFDLLVELTRKPILFLTRDPRLAGWSRMKKLIEGGQDPIFPRKESGWDDLLQQLRTCKENGVPYAIVDSTAFRNQPESVLPRLFARLGLPFSPAMLRWDSYGDLQLGNLDSEQDHWYARVLESTGLEPATSAPRSIEEFPEALRSHLRECLEAYRGLIRDENSISP